MGLGFRVCMAQKRQIRFRGSQGLETNKYWPVCDNCLSQRSNSSPSLNPKPLPSKKQYEVSRESGSGRITRNQVPKLSHSHTRRVRRI